MRVWAQDGTTVTGRILAVEGGLPVSGAKVELEHGSAVVSTVTTGNNGTFAFANQAPGVYNIRVSAKGYQTSISDDIIVIGSESQVNEQLAIEQDTSAGNLRTIAAVRVSANASLQTSATINNHLDPALLQSEDYMRAGDALATLPFVNGSTSSSIGDDLSLSIRGYDSSETLTLLDGHPMGPIGAGSGGFDSQVSPFWGLSNLNVVYGSGAAGLYGAPTMAGAIDYETITPTRESHFTVTQGIGNFGKELSGMSATGMFGKLGYATAYGVQGTSGELVGNPLQSNLLLSPSQCSPDDPNGTPSLMASDISACSYRVDGNYLLRNFIGKLTYDVSPDTQLLFGNYDASMNADSPGNGDTDYVTQPEMQQQFGSGPSGGTDTQTLPSGASVSCNNSYVVLNDSSQGYQCMSPSQFVQTFAGPAGGGPGRYHAAVLQDYHGRLTQRVGPTSLILDDFTDNYNFVNVKGPATAHHYDNITRTHGFLLSDEYMIGKHDISAGLFAEHEDEFGMDVGKGTTYPDLQMATSNYFLRDTYTANAGFTTFIDMDVQRSHDTATTYFNPRISFMFRPTSSDVLRIAAGRSSSEPDASLIDGGVQYGSPASYNPTCEPSLLDSIGGGSNPALKPEAADDYELSYGHRFAQHTVVQVDAYDSYELNPLVGGTFPLSTVPAGQQVDPADLAAFLSKLQAHCGSSYTASHFGVSDTFNAGSGRYQGMDLNATIGLTPNFTLNGDWAVQSAAFYGMNNDILANNASLINGGQLSSAPLHRADLGLAYSNPAGFGARLDGYWVGTPNGLNRPAYMFANASISKTFAQGFSVNLGVNNVFNNDAQQYGLIGLGQLQPQNPIGGDPSATALIQGSEEYGLPLRQFWLTFTHKT